MSCKDGNLNDVIEILNKGVDVNIRFAGSNFTPLISSSCYGRLDIVKYLISKGADIEAKSFNGHTALNRSFHNGRLLVAKFLILNGADIDSKNKDNKSCFDFLTYTNYEIEKLICEKYGAHVLLKHKIPLHKWIKEEYPEESITDELGFFESVNMNQKELNKELLDACGGENSKGDLNIVKELIEKGADVNTKRDIGRFEGWSPLLIASLNGSVDILKYLIKKGADINYMSSSGCFPIDRASYAERIEIVKYLISCKVDIQKVDQSGRNCFYFGSKKMWNSYEMQKLIIEKYPNGYQIIKNNKRKIDIHKWIKNEDIAIVDELGFFEKRIS